MMLMVGCTYLDDSILSFALFQSFSLIYYP